MSKYQPLIESLLNQASAANELVLSFSELERMLGFRLPPSARENGSWWANARNGNPSGKWLAAGWKVKWADRAGEQVVFVRQSENEDGRLGKIEEVRKPDQGDYANLTRFLKNLPDKQEQLALSFTELGEIIGKQLPPVALNNRNSWVNSRGNHYGSFWMNAKWEVERVFLKAQVVIFRRTGRNPVREIPRYLQCILDASRYQRHPDSRTLAEWIRFCRRVGWYYEGTALYEKGGLELDSLDETGSVEVEEDYLVCKRELLRYKNHEMATLVRE